nr:MAG TPA: minor tail protein [Caudoviricetes sp.]
MAEEESTTKIKVDLSEMKKEFQEAQRQIRLVNSEFKAATSGMDNWANSADGLSAKTKQLTSILNAETTKLASLKQQYELVAESQGEDSRAAQELMIKINNQSAAVQRTYTTLTQYTQQLNDMRDEANHVATASESLREEINKQENELNTLRERYSDIVLEQGRETEEARQCASEIQALSNELRENRSRLENASQTSEELARNLDNVEDSAENASDGFTIIKGAIASLVGDVIKSGIDALKNFISEADSVNKKFQAQTGASASEMKKFSKEMDILYKNNYGESLGDIGDKMAYIKQTTQETDPSKIKKLTENAMTLEEVFGSDFAETTRGVQNLMQHFGISVEEAFDLFAKGSQEGLDYTDELGDNIAEYAGNFQQAGYTAEEYFQLLKNGTKGGAYNLDKVNDSINEIKNRLGDGSIGKTMAQYDKKTKKLIDGTGIWSQETEKAYKAWEDGKGTMKDVIDSIVKDISNCKDEQKALTLASTAFGTMGEDANLKVVKSLTTVGDTFKDVKGTMDEVKNTRLDTIANNIETIKRGLLINIVEPIAGPVLSALVKFGEWFPQNIPIIISLLASIGTALLVLNISSIVGAATSAIGTLITSIELLGLAIASNPVGLVATVLATGTAAFIAYRKATEKAREKADENVIATNNLIDAQKELNDTLDTNSEQRENNNQQAQTQNKQADIYFDRISALLEVEEKSTGQKKLLAEYTQKLNDIMPDLNLQYDDEKDKLNQSTDAIREQIKAQKDLILAKAAQTNLETIASDIVDTEMQQANLSKQQADNELAYKDAVEKTQKAKEQYERKDVVFKKKDYDNYLKAMQNEANKKKALEDTNKAIEDNKKKLQSLNDEYNKTEQYATEKYETGTIEMQLSQITEKMRKKGLEIPKAISEGMKNGEYVIPTTVKGMQNLIDFTELAKKAGIDGKKIPTALATAISNGKLTAKQAIENLENLSVFKDSKLVKDAEKLGIEIPKSLSNGILTGKVTVKQASERISDATSFIKAVSKNKKIGDDVINSYVKKILNGKTTASKAGEAIANETAKGSSKGKTKMAKSGKSNADSYNKSAEAQKGKSNKVGKTLGDETAKSSKNTKGMSKTGKDNVVSYNKGMASQKGNVARTSKEIKSTTTTNLNGGSTTTYNSGANLVRGFINGMGSLLGNVISKAKAIAYAAINAIRKTQKEHSPSKVTYKSGRYFGMGYANGIVSTSKLVIKSARDLGIKAIKNATPPKNSLYQQGKSFVKGYIKSISNEEKSLVNITKSLVTKVSKELLKLNNFSDIQSKANETFSDSISKKVEYINAKAQYQNNQKLSELESKLSSYESKQSKYQKQYDTAKSAYDKAKKNIASADKKTMKTESAKMSAAKKQVANYKKLVKDQKTFNEAYQNASSEMLSELSTALSEYQSKAQDLINDTINEISDKYQAKYDALTEKQDNLISKLKSAGSLFDISSAGIMTVNDIKQQTKEIQDYANKLQKIKNKVSADLFDEITNYDIDEGSAFVDRLLAMSDKELKEYSDAYDNKNKITESLSKKIYQKDFENIKKAYNEEVKKAFASLPSKLEKLGDQVMKGFVKGLKGNTDYMTKTVKTMIKSMVDTFKKDLKIHSPSRVTRELGNFVGLGFGDGIVDSIRQARKDARAFINSIAEPFDSIQLGAMKGNVNAANVGKCTSSNQTIINNYNLVQNNTSPKSLSALETYRARRQQVSMLKAMTQ